MGEHVPSKRNFLKKAGGVVVTAIVSPNIIAKALESLHIPKGLEKEDGIVEYDFADIEYPKDIEKEVPELLQAYAKNFTSWIEVVTDQREVAGGFADSSIFKEKFLNTLTLYFKNTKRENEAIQIGESFLVELKDRIHSADLFYRDLGERSLNGMYMHEKGKNEVILDTLEMEKTNQEFINYSTGNKHILSRLTMFTPIHEFWHPINSGDRMLISNFIYILDLLEKYQYIDKDKKRRIIKRQNFKESSGRVSFNRKVVNSYLPYFLQPYEISSYFMEMKTSLYFVSRYHPDLISFDMNKDRFTQEHLDFLKNNHERIFPVLSEISSNSGRELSKSTMFSYYLKVFKDEDFVALMNRSF